MKYQPSQPIRNRAKFSLFLLVMWGGIFACSSNLAATDLDEAEFQKLHAELVPREKAWKTIPWETDLLAAQAKAAKEKKLIFIWSMDGHPLGCT
ncbi:MAG: hypothetical protein AB8B55_21740 [Mariniblastus sp.]